MQDWRRSAQINHWLHKENSGKSFRRRKTTFSTERQIRLTFNKQIDSIESRQVGTNQRPWTCDHRCPLRQTGRWKPTQTGQEIEHAVTPTQVYRSWHWSRWSRVGTSITVKSDSHPRSHARRWLYTSGQGKPRLLRHPTFPRCRWFNLGAPKPCGLAERVDEKRVK